MLTSEEMSFLIFMKKHNTWLWLTKNNGIIIHIGHIIVNFNIFKKRIISLLKKGFIIIELYPKYYPYKQHIKITEKAYKYLNNYQLDYSI